MHQDMQGWKRRERVDTIPHLRLGRHDMTSLCQVVATYLAYLRKEVPPSRQRHEQIQALQRVQAMLLRAQTQKSKEEVAVLLRHDELEALCAAMGGFVRLVRQMIPASAERDDVIQALQKIHAQLRAMRSSPLN